MDKPINNSKKQYTPEQIKRRNRKAVMLTVIILTLFLSSILLIRVFFLNKGLSFGNVNGLSSQEESSLTKINFIDSGSVRSTSGTFGSVSSQFTPDFTKKFWISLLAQGKTMVGFVDSDLKFNKIYELPSSIKLVRLLDDESILFTDEPLKEQPSLYYQKVGSEIFKFSTLDFQDTYLSIYFDPSEKLIYYLVKDNANTFFLYSVNEKGVESSLYKTGDFKDKVTIVAVDESYLYFNDSNVCYQLNFALRENNLISCDLVKKNSLNLNYSVNPPIQSAYTTNESGQILKVLNNGERILLASLQAEQVVSKISYSSNKLIFARAALNPAGETTYVSKDVAISLLDLNSNQVVELTSKLSNEVISNYYVFGDKYLAVGGAQNSKVQYYVSSGQSGQVYIGDVSPVSFATITKYWVDIDFGMSVSNVNVLNGDFIL